MLKTTLTHYEKQHGKQIQLRREINVLIAGGSKLSTLDLFSGCGAMNLGLHEFCKTVAYAESNKECREVLKKNMKRGYLHKAKIYNDVRDLINKNLKVDLIAGGFPCQDISGAGKQRGLKGKHSSLLLVVLKLVKKMKPRHVFLENVANIVNMPSVWKRLLKDLDTFGYDARWCIISAGSLGAPHMRRRWFMLATKRGKKIQKQQLPKFSKKKWNEHWKYSGWQPKVDRMLKNDIVTYLLDNTKFDMPDEFLKRWLVHTSEQEVTLDQIESEYGMYSKSLRWQLIENNILENFDVKVSAEEVEGHTRSLISMQMGQYGQAVPEEDKMNEIVANVLMKEEERKKVYDQLYDVKTLSLYKENFKLSEKAISYDDFVKLASEK